MPDTNKDHSDKKYTDKNIRIRNIRIEEQSKADRDYYSMENNKIKDKIE